jgi:hypothetical protein
MNLMIIGIVAFLVPTIIARFVAEKGMKVLSDEQRGQLVTALSGTRKWSLIALSVIIVGFLVVAYNFQVNKRAAVYAYFAAILIYMMVVNGLNWYKTKKMGFPEAYLRSNLLASILRLLGLVALLVCMADYLAENMQVLEKAG